MIYHARARCPSPSCAFFVHPKPHSSADYTFIPYLVASISWRTSIVSYGNPSMDLPRMSSSSTDMASPRDASPSTSSRSSSPPPGRSPARALSSALGLERGGRSGSGGPGGPSKEARPPKKRKPPGWKGWAMEVQDDDGNWVTVAPGSDPRDPIPRPLSAQETRGERGEFYAWRRGRVENC